jgi:hypothetical protein
MLFVSNILDFRCIPLFISKEAYSYSINGFKTYEFICKIFINRKVFSIGACYYCPYIQKKTLSGKPGLKGDVAWKERMADSPKLLSTLHEAYRQRGGDQPGMSAL